MRAYDTYLLHFSVIARVIDVGKATEVAGPTWDRIHVDTLSQERLKRFSIDFKCLKLFH